MPPRSTKPSGTSVPRATASMVDTSSASSPSKRAAAQQAAQQLTESSAVAAWTRDQELAVCAWWAKPGADGQAGAGLKAFLRNRKAVAEIMLEEMGKDATLRMEKYTLNQILNKTDKMIRTYKEHLDLLNTSGGGVDREQHESAVWLWEKKGGKKKKAETETIKTYLDRCCPWFYALDDLMSTRASVNPPLLMEGGVPSAQSISSRAPSRPGTARASHVGSGLLQSTRNRDAAGGSKEGQEESDTDSISNSIVSDSLGNALLEEEAHRIGRGDASDSGEEEAGPKATAHKEKGKEARAETPARIEGQVQSMSSNASRASKGKQGSKSTHPILTGQPAPRRSTSGSSTMADAVVKMMELEQKRAEAKQGEEKLDRSRTDREKERAETARLLQDRERLTTEREMEEKKLDLEKETKEQELALEDRKLMAAERKEKLARDERMEMLRLQRDDAAAERVAERERQRWERERMEWERQRERQAAEERERRDRQEREERAEERRQQAEERAEDRRQQAEERRQQEQARAEERRQDQAREDARRQQEWMLQQQMSQQQQQQQQMLLMVMLQATSNGRLPPVPPHTSSRPSFGTAGGPGSSANAASTVKDGDEEV